MAATDPWMFELAPRRGRVNLICLPYAGGGTSAFHDWPDRLPGYVNIWAARLPGRESRLLEPAYTDAVRLAGALAEAIVPLTELPYVVFGHSMGALVGFEVARALRRLSVPPPAWIIASGHEAPHVADHRYALHTLPDAELVAQLREYGATPEELLSQPDLLDLFLPTIRADFAVVETYRHRPEPPLECDLAVYYGDRDPDVRAAGCIAWRELITGHCVIRRFAGGHFFVDDERDAVIADLVSRLDDTLQARTRSAS